MTVVLVGYDMFVSWRIVVEDGRLFRFTYMGYDRFGRQSIARHFDPVITVDTGRGRVQLL